MASQSKPTTYLFHGSDTFSSSQKIKRWKREFTKKHGNAQMIVIDCAEPQSDALEQLKRFFKSSATLFSSTQLAIVKHFFGCKREDIHALVLENIPRIDPSQFIVFHEEKIDGRTSLYKQFLALDANGVIKIEEYRIPSGIALAQWVSTISAEMGGHFEGDAVASLCRMFDPPEREALREEVLYDLWQVCNEIEKCIAYVRGRAITRQDIELLVAKPTWGHVFTLTDAILLKNRTLAFETAHGLFGSDNPSKLKSEVIRIVSSLVTQFRNFLLVKNLLATETQTTIAQKMNWNEKRVWVVARKLQTVSLERLRSMYESLLGFDFQMKVSRIAPDIEFDFLLQKIVE